MKGMDLFCSSPSSTAVTYSMDHRSSNIRTSTKSYDHERRRDKEQLPHVPCSSQLPINPKSYLEKHRKSSAEKEKSDTRRKRSVHVNDLYNITESITGSGSSGRYLLGEAPFIDLISPRHDDKVKSMVMKTKESHDALIRSSSSAHSNDQVFFNSFDVCNRIYS